MSKPNNPPAFPSDRACQSWQCRKPSEGMTLRDYFAAKATTEDIQDFLDRGILTREEAKFAYADRMLEARPK